MNALVAHASIVTPEFSYSKPVRILHFVTGGFTGSTSVALTLTNAEQRSSHFESMIVLREKSSTDKDRVAQLIADGVKLKLVPGWSHALSIFALYKICKEYQPDILVTHGFSEHLWGRYAGLLAKVPHMVHVEHNSRERYTPIRLLQARWLAQFTDKIVGCSAGVRERLLELKFPADKVSYINNGISTVAFQNPPKYQDRLPGIVMPARFANQKDHLTLIKAIALLRDQQLFPQVILAGTGKEKHRQKAERLVAELGLENQIHFIGQCHQVPQLLMQHQLCVLSTRYEGMPLSLVEGMTAGCAVIGSAVVGVREMIRNGEDGLLAVAGSAESLANAIAYCLNNPETAAQMGQTARKRALKEFSLQQMQKNYEDLYHTILHNNLVPHLIPGVAAS
jgi:glycosyltransferase involved in cell wall biosynthesis